MSTPDRTLFLSTFAPVFTGGRALRTYTCVRALAMLGPVDLAYVAHDADEPAPEYQAIPGIEFHRIKSSRGLERGALYLSKRLQGIPDLCSRGTSPELVETAERLAEDRSRGRIVAGDTSAATGLMDLATRRPVVYNAHNIESEYVDGAPGLRAFSSLAMRRYERRLLEIVDESWMVSRTDIRSAAALVPSARLRYVPNAVDVARIAPHRVRTGTASGRSRLLMVGDFHYTPNLSGLEFLIGQVLPLIWTERPDVILTVVGRGLDSWESPDARIQATGFVDSLDPQYAHADCAVVPLTEGAGTPLKFVEALAYGMPLVATPLAAKGLEVSPGMHYLEAGNAPSFAEGVLDILRDGGEKLGAQGRLLAEREYSIEALAERLRDPQPDRPARPSPTSRSLASAARASSYSRPAPVRFASHAVGAGLGRQYPFVLCYHGVGSIAGPSDPNSIFVGRSLFESHLEVIAEQGYELVSVGELWRHVRDGSGLGLGSVTFDDGLVKTVREGLPLLLERGVRCSIFVPTGLMGQPHPDLHGELIVSAEEVCELAAAGVEIGAHSVDHLPLNQLSYADALDQMRRSRADLEDLLGEPVTAMAYPFGAFDRLTTAAAKQAGYEIACACSGPGPWRAMSVPREPVFASATPLRLRLKMAGLYGPAYAMVGDRGPLHRLRSARIRP